jgi:prephenate dehydrogenase
MPDTAVPRRIERLTLFGVGLIGGSFAAALRAANAVGHITGVGRSRANLERALALGVIDEIARDARGAVESADFILVAVPVRQTAAVFASIVPHLPSEAILTDAGSTKQDVIAAARQVLGPRLRQFVPAHPIAGAELTGVEAARSGLYQGRTVVITPLPETDAAMSARVEAAWRTCGARVVRMSPERHDAVFAAVSHLPHALAFALVHMIATRLDADALFAQAGAGFRDFTRIASSSPEMWRDICVSNRDALLAEIDAYQAELLALRALIAAGDADRIERVFTDARSARNRWLDSSK